jgi:TetR/AcrR family transcriptional regulator, ethionamide resistance regulator
VATKEHMASRIVPAKEQSRRQLWVELARTEILDATEQLLRKLSFSELNVTVVMERTRLSRSSFYEYFKDLHEVLLMLTKRVVEEMAELTTEVDRRAPSAEDRGGYLAALREKYLISCRLHRKHRHLYRALVEAANSDSAVAKLLEDYLESMTQGAIENLRNVQKAGGAKGLNVRETARAMILMTEGYILEQLCRRRAADLEQVTDTMLTILDRVCFGVVPPLR